MVLMDTHIWLWWLGNTANLNDLQKLKLNELSRDRKLGISMISIWEVEILERKGKIQLGLGFREWVLEATRSSLVQVLQIDEQVILHQRQLPESFHSDPADRLIATTAMLAGFHLATKDKKIIDSGTCNIWSV